MGKPGKSKGEKSMKTHSVKFNFIMNAILTVSSVLFPLITFPYISRVLLVAGNGKVAFATSVVSYFTMFASLGLPTYGVRACAKVRDDKEKLSQTVQELLIISGITTAITYIVFFVSLFVIPEFAAERKLLMVTALSIGLTSIGVQWLYNALEQYSYITTCALVFKVIGMALMFILIRKPEDYVLYGFVYVVGSFGSYVMNFLRLRKFVSFKKTGSYNLRQHIKPTLRFFLLSAATSVYLNLDVVMLQFMKGDIEVGYYNAGIKVKTVLVTCVTSLGTVMLPRLSYYVQQEAEEAFRKLVAKAFSFVLIVATAVSIYFTLYAKESILLLAGKDFLPAVGPMVILMPTVLLIGLSNITGIQILTPRGEEIKVVYSVTAGAVLDFVFNLILIPKFGADGAAFSTLMAEVLVLAIQGFGLHKELKGIVKEIQVWKIILGLAGATAAGYFAGALTNLGVFFTLCVSALFFFGTYGIILLMLRETFVTSTLESCLRLVKKRG